MPPRRHCAVAAAALAVVGVLAACSGPPDTGTIAVVHEATIATAADLRPPVPAEVALTVDYADGTSVQLSIAQLEALRTVSARVHEPFVNRDIVFEGVPLSDLFTFLRIPQSVQKLHTLALNEYAVDLPMSITDVEGAFLATRADGALIPLDEGGPTRVVLTNDHPQAQDESLWIWSLKSLSVP
ncbi:MAG: hypothetical protein ACOH2F_06365 [Cellulomonas sp.]